MLDTEDFFFRRGRKLKKVSAGRLSCHYQARVERFHRVLLSSSWWYMASLSETVNALPFLANQNVEQVLDGLFIEIHITGFNHFNGLLSCWLQQGFTLKYFIGLSDQLFTWSIGSMLWWWYSLEPSLLRNKDSRVWFLVSVLSCGTCKWHFSHFLVHMVFRHKLLLVSCVYLICLRGIAKEPYRISSSAVVSMSPWADQVFQQLQLPGLCKR